jgi:hypothetical protein
MTDGGSGHAVASDQCPTWAASKANLRDHAVRLRNRRRRYCLRRSCNGYDKASSSNQPRTRNQLRVEPNRLFARGERHLGPFNGSAPRLQTANDCDDRDQQEQPGEYRRPPGTCAGCPSSERLKPASVPTSRPAQSQRPASAPTLCRAVFLETCRSRPRRCRELRSRPRPLLVPYPG